MFKKNYLPDWIVFIFAGIFLYIIYGLKITKLLEFLLQWTFAVTGFKLLVDYGLIKIIFSKKKINKMIGHITKTTKKLK